MTEAYRAAMLVCTGLLVGGGVVSWLGLANRSGVAPPAGPDR